MAEVMLVDDDTDLRGMMAAILSQAGYKVVACDSGLEALKKLGIQPDDEDVKLPDLLVLDIMMPRSDGYSVGTAIRGNPRTHGIPILVVSALGEMSRLFADRVQVEGFLAKPFTTAALIGSVAKILDKRRVQG
ncbi:MAG: response regulator [Elusimicrobia bacterium]|nr:response regulator [Elusimicrobiota bacterium]